MEDRKGRIRCRQRMKPIPRSWQRTVCDACVTYASRLGYYKIQETIALKN
jgi:hypothetical protein